MKLCLYQTLVFSFAVASLLPQMDTYELSKLPHLIEHFQEHSRKNASFTLLDFLSLHYGSQKKNHEDNHQDTGCLPFQQHAVSGLFFVLDTVHFICTQQTEYQMIRKPFYKAVYHTVYVASIWQPPRSL
jgi:hypothetical protein